MQTASSRTWTRSVESFSYDNKPHDMFTSSFLDVIHLIESFHKSFLYNAFLFFFFLSFFFLHLGNPIHLRTHIRTSLPHSLNLSLSPPLSLSLTHFVSVRLFFILVSTSYFFQPHLYLLSLSLSFSLSFFLSFFLSVQRFYEFYLLEFYSFFFSRNLFLYANWSGTAIHLILRACQDSKKSE